MFHNDFIYLSATADSKLCFRRPKTTTSSEVKNVKTDEISIKNGNQQKRKKTFGG